MAMANGQRALARAVRRPVSLGIGVSHVPSVEGVRSHSQRKPVATMRGYLDAMRAAPYGAPEPAEKPLTILAALGPRMLALSSSHADGSTPTTSPPAHRRGAPHHGPGQALCPEIWVFVGERFGEGPGTRSPGARNYMRLDNYVNNWRRLGFGDDDFAGGSDHFVDANVAWGGEAAIQAHRRAVGRRRRSCLHPVDQPRRLAPAGRKSAGAARPKGHG